MSTMKFTSWQDLDGNEVANSAYPPGLVLVKSVTIGSNVTSITVTNAFSSNFDNYRITLTGHTTNADSNIFLGIPNVSTGWYGSYYYDKYDGTSTGTARRNNAANTYIGTASTSPEGSTVFDWTNPYNSAALSVIHGMDYNNGFSGWFAGSNYSTYSFTDFTVLCGSGRTMTGGTIRVYGYQQ